MKLLEHETKGIFAQHGIRTPHGISAERAEEIISFHKKLGKPFVLKPDGIKKRGVAGAIAFVNTEKEIEEFVGKTIGETIKGEKIKKVLAEERIDIEKELYVAVTIDYSSRRPVLIVGTEGGVDIEEAVKRGNVKKIEIDITKGIDMQRAKDTIQDLLGDYTGGLLEVAQNLYKIFRKYDAEIVEINPLALVKGGDYVAVDAFMEINEDSLFRHPELENVVKDRKYKTMHEKSMREMGWSYMDMEGDIGIICSGAGLSMATLDLIQLYGGKPANFLDMAQVDGEGIYKAFEILCCKESIKAILVNLFAGLNRCDSMAMGVRDFVAKNSIEVPVVVRMVGNREEDGTRVLKDAGIENFSELEKAVETVVKVCNNG